MWELKFAIKEFVYKCIKLLLNIFRIFSVKKDVIVFRSSRGERYHCNPKYITEYILENFRDDFKIVWVFNNPEKYRFLEDKGI